MAATNVPDVDMPFIENTQYCTDCSMEIQKYLRRTEHHFHPNYKVLAKNAIINNGMVANLVDYLVKIVRRHRLRKETLFLTLNMIYRCLEKMSIKDIFNFELLAITCVMIAAKYEEIYPPQT